MAGFGKDWLNDFVTYTNYGESSPKILYWVGVSTIAGALRRKVWIDQVYFQWTPNFYILIVGEPGRVKKSTSIGLGTAFLKRVPDIDFGADSTTWQQLMSHMAASKQTYQIDDQPFEACCVTVNLSEFGTFFDPSDRNLVDNLTDIWDAKLGVIRKETKTMGNDEIVNPWLNIAACTTPGWLSDNMTRKLLRSGFASRPVFIYETDQVKDVPYPSLAVPNCGEMRGIENSLMERLLQIADYAGEFKMTKEAYEWGSAWYMGYRKTLRDMSSDQEAAFYERKQTHLHKLAMVISASRGDFPYIRPEHLMEADLRLTELDPDVKKIFGFVGQTKLTQAASEILGVVQRLKSIRKSDLYRDHFFRTMDVNEFDVALRSVQASGRIGIEGPLDDLVVRLKK